MVQDITPAIWLESELHLAAVASFYISKLLGGYYHAEFLVLDTDSRVSIDRYARFFMAIMLNFT